MGCYLRQCFRQIWQGLLVHEALRHPDHQDKDQSGQSPRCYPCGGSHMNSACYFSNWKDAPEFRKPSTIHQKSEQQNWKTQGKDSNKLSWDIVGGVRGFEMNLCHHFTWVKSEFRWWTCLVFWLYSYNIVGESSQTRGWIFYFFFFSDLGRGKNKITRSGHLNCSNFLRLNTFKLFFS